VGVGVGEGWGVAETCGVRVVVGSGWLVSDERGRLQPARSSRKMRIRKIAFFIRCSIQTGWVSRLYPLSNMETREIALPFWIK